MSKLFKLKEWLTIKDTAVHLSNILSEPVSEADVLRLGLDGYLTLSINFVNHAPARIGKVVPYRDARRRPVRSINDKDRSDFFENDMFGSQQESETEQSQQDVQQLLAKLSNCFEPLEDILKGDIEGIYIADGRVLEFEKKHVYQIEGVWDLPMIGNERIAIERQYQKLTGGPPVELISLNGTFVERSNGIMCQLQESFGDYYEYRAAISAQHIKLRRLELSKSINTRKEKLLILRREKLDKLTKIEKEWNKFEKYFPAGGLPKDRVLVVRTEAIRGFEQFLMENEAEGKISTKPHGNTEQNAQKREQVLGAAFAVLAKWPGECRDRKGEPVASKIAAMIDAKANLFWPDAQPPLATDSIADHLRNWIKKASSGRK